MAGLIFAISILSILTTVGFLFAWMVRLASNTDVEPQSNQPNIREELSPSRVRAGQR